MIAIFALTYDAVELGKKIKLKYREADLFVPQRYQDKFHCIGMEKKFREELAGKWENYSKYIMIMAAGIVVRSIASLMENKEKDPAVLVVDQRGQYVIPLISGHWGGANSFAKELAKYLDGVPVITTASDVQGYTSLDDLARQNRCCIEYGENLKRIATFLLDKKPVALYHTVNLEGRFPSHVVDCKNIERLKTRQLSAAVFVTEKILDLKDFKIPYIYLRPKNIIIGFGCRKGKSKEEIAQAVQTALQKAKISIQSVKEIATIDIKGKEPGLLDFCKERNLPLQIYTKEEIQKVEKQFSESSFVKKTVGVRAVCEPAAYLSAKEPTMLRPKEIYDGITIAVVKDESILLKDENG